MFITALLDPEAADEPLAAGWKRGLKQYLLLHATAHFGSKLKTEKLKTLAADPLVVTALQAVAVGTAASISVLGVLAIDGSAESVEALMPYFSSVMGGEHGLEWFQQLRKVATKTPGMTAMLEQVEARFGNRSSRR